MQRGEVIGHRFETVFHSMAKTESDTVGLANLSGQKRSIAAAAKSELGEKIASGLPVARVSSATDVSRQPNPPTHRAIVFVGGGRGEDGWVGTGIRGTRCLRVGYLFGADPNFRQ